MAHCKTTSIRWEQPVRVPSVRSADPTAFGMFRVIGKTTKETMGVSHLNFSSSPPLRRPGRSELGRALAAC
eukprot:756037-Hanusia_phi.AAC.1